MNATTRRTPPSGSYRLRRGYCLVRAVGIQFGPDVHLDGDLGGATSPTLNLDTRGSDSDWEQAERTGGVLCFKCRHRPGTGVYSKWWVTNCANRVERIMYHW